MDYDQLEADLEAERRLAAEVDEAMRNVTKQMTGEVWADIVSILRSERDHIRRLDYATKEAVEQILSVADEQCSYVLDLAKAQDEAEFWEELKKLRNLLDTVDNNILGAYQIYAATRIGLHVYYKALLTKYQEQADFLKE